MEMGRCTLARHPYTVLSGETSALGWGGQRILQQEGNNSFKCDPFQSKLGSEHPAGPSLASPAAGKILWMMICSGASAEELGLQAGIKQGAECWSLPGATPKSGFVSPEGVGLSTGRKVRYKPRYSGPQQVVWWGSAVEVTQAPVWCLFLTLPHSEP